MANNIISALQFGGATGDIYTLTLPYGVCSTDAKETVKVVTVNSFTRETGARILVKFSNDNTASTTLQLNVNNTGAADIYYHGNKIAGTAFATTALVANRIYEFVFDGSYWHLIGDLDTDTNTEQTLTITENDQGAPTTETVNVVTILEESGAKGHTVKAQRVPMPTKKYIDDKIENLGQALRFLGTSTTAISDGATTNPITVNNESVTVRTGDVVLYGGYEYVWVGSAWEQFGQEGSFSVQGHKHSVTVKGTTGNNSANTTVASGSVSSSGAGATVVTGSKSSVNVLTGVKASGTKSVVTGVNGGSGSLNVFESSSAPTAEPDEGRIAFVQSIESTPATASGTATVLTGVKASSTDKFLKSINTGSGTLTSDTTASGGIGYVSSISSTGASVSATANAITSITPTTESFVKTVSGGSGSLKSYSAASGGSEVIADGTRVPYVASVTHTEASLGTPDTSSAAPGGHTHTYDKATSVTLTANSSTATGRVTYVQSISGGSGSLTTSDTNGTNTIPYVASIESTPATATGTTKVGSETHTHTYTKTTGVNLGSNSTSTDGVKYVEAISGGSGSLKAYDAASDGNAVIASGRVPYVASVTHTPASLTGTTTFVTGVNGGSGSLTSGTTNSTGAIPYIAAQGTFSAGTTPPESASFTGTATTALVTDATTKYAHFTAGTIPPKSASLGYTDTASGANSGTAVAAVTDVKASSTATSVNASYENGILTLTPITVVTGVGVKSTANVAPANHTHAYAKATSVSFTTGTAPSLTYDSNSSGGQAVVVGVTKGSYTPAGSVTFTAGTAPSLGAATTKYLTHTHTAASASGSASVGISGGSISVTTQYLAHSHSKATATTKYFHPTVTTSDVASGAPSATETVVTGVTGGSTSATTKYLAHVHTAASATTKYLSAAPGVTSVSTGANSGTNVDAVTGYSSFSGGSISPTTRYLAHAHTGASAGSTANAITGITPGTTAVATEVTGGTTTATTRYLHHTHTSASTNDNNLGTAVTGVSKDGTATVVTGVTGGVTSATTRYLDHTHNPASASGTTDAVTGVVSNGTVAAITELATSKLNTTTVASNAHTHSYGSDTALTTTSDK